MELQVIDFESPLYSQVLDLRQRVLRVPIGLNLYDEDLREDRDQYIVVLTKSDVVKACLMIKIIGNDVVKFRQMAVDPIEQGKGYGSMVVGYAENFCVLNDYFHIELHARITAKDFYTKHGYQITGIQFEEVGLPHVRMIKSMSITPA
jgi:predicted GNAT family N-acyltransferase